MQLVFGDLLKKVPWILKNIKVYFSAMQSMHCGKAQTKFIEKAAELGHTVLTNKKFQQTRFVRSLQRGNTPGPWFVRISLVRFSLVRSFKKFLKSHVRGQIQMSFQDEFWPIVYVFTYRK